LSAGLASTEQREKYKELKSASNRCQGDINALKTVTEELRTAYETHKSDCALGRYEALKKMVKETGCRYETVMEKRRKDPNGGSNRRSGERQEIKAFAVRASIIARKCLFECILQSLIFQFRNGHRDHTDVSEPLVKSIIKVNETVTRNG